LENSIEISVIILAGGKSSRLGTDKRSIKLNNRSLIDYSLALARKVSDDIVFSANDYLPNFKEHKVIPDEVEGAGPIQGIISSMKQIKYTHCLLLTCDMPFISLKLINSLILRSEEEFITHYDSAYQFYPFPSVIPISMHQKIIDLEKAGKNSLKSIFLSFPTKEIDLPDETTKFAFLNVNRPEDYKMAKKYLNELPDLHPNL
jgi:molybdopterin-guanine dinucleotide biosynthesis protein A